MADYTVTINMDQTTVETLFDNGNYLYAFKAVVGTGSGAPLVWFETQDYSLATVIDWDAQYQAYTSRSSITPNARITSTANYDIELGQTLNVTSPQGTGAVDPAVGTPGAISIYNETTTQFTCGISQQIPGGGAYSPVCAFPLFGLNLDLVTPAEKVFLTFSNQPVDTGTAIFQSFSAGVLIDLTSVSQRTVSYNLNSGWGGDIAALYPPNANLIPILITDSGSGSGSAALEQERLAILGARAEGSAVASLHG